MLNQIETLAKELLELSKDKSIRIISHYDTDGITSAAILAKTLKRLDKKFSIRIVKNLDEEIIKSELKKQEKEVLFFTDLASGSLHHFQDLKEQIFILDHHEINKEKLNKKIRIINPHLFNEEEVCGAGLTYLFSKAISKENTDLANLAIIGMVGDRLDEEISRINQQIINDAKDLQIKKGLLIFSATRPLRRALEYSASCYIPNVTGSPQGVIELLREIKISPEKTLYELTEEEMSKLVTAVMLRRVKYEGKEKIIGNIYLLKMFNRKEDARELSVLINACSRLGYSDTAIAFCLGDEKAKNNSQEIYLKYKQEIISGLKIAEKAEKIIGNGFVILNAKDQIKDALIGTICSIISSSPTYEQGTILIGMAYNEDKIKVSARIVGARGRNLKEMLEKTIIEFNENCKTKSEVGGHQNAAGCLVEKAKEEDFIQTLKKNLEIEIVKI